MHVTLTPDQEALIRHAVETGRLAQAEDAVREALALSAERERKRAELLAAIDEAEASLARGEGIDITDESAQRLVADIQRRGRARLGTQAEIPG